MGFLTVTGTLVEGPPSSGDCPAFPSGTTSIGFSLNSVPKPSNVSTGDKIRNVNSASAFVTLSGVGASDDVTQADTVYMRVKSGNMQFRVTYNVPPSGPDIVSVLPSAGIFIHEADAQGGFYIKKLEVQGVGIVEYFASGMQ